jgi:hypothetical protein
MRNVMVVGSVVLVACGAVPQQHLDAGVETNRPPRITSSTPFDVRSTWYASTFCTSLNPQFTVSVQDPDGDSLRSLWFIDKSASSAPFMGSPRPAGQEVQRIEAPAALSFNSALANLPTGVHLLTVYVADSDFNEVVDQSVTVSRADGFFDSFTWVLDAEPCP